MGAELFQVMEKHSAIALFDGLFVIIAIGEGGVGKTVVPWKSAVDAAEAMNGGGKGDLCTISREALS